jgi:hypothetical protein
LLAVIPLLVAGCLNMPTPPSQITPAMNTGIRYQDYDCNDLMAELDSLSRRENQLVVAQDQRIKTSKVQAFWWGVGEGDGVEASELAVVRGKKEAVLLALGRNDCDEINDPAEKEVIFESFEEATG